MSASSCVFCDAVGLSPPCEHSVDYILMIGYVAAKTEKEPGEVQRNSCLKHQMQLIELIDDRMK